METPRTGSRDFDLVLYGATGFVGKQTAHYVSVHPDARRLRWAIAARNEAKLREVSDELWSASNASEPAEAIVAAAEDQPALDRLAARTRVVLNTAGPFARYATGLVDACVRHGTHYVDITGETPWVRTLIDRYHERASRDGTQIVPCCGFDSVPADLGSWLVVRTIRQKYGQACRRVRAYYQLRGDLNGGTLASALAMYEAGEQRVFRQPFLLNPPGTIPPEVMRESRDPVGPRYDARVEAWTSPFFMGPVNSRVVRRSAALFQAWHQGYGDRFTYLEYLKWSRRSNLGSGEPVKFNWLQRTIDAVQPPLTAGVVSLVSGVASVALRWEAARRRLKQSLPKPGEGPTERSMNRGWFRCELVGESEGGRMVRALVADRGDPGNRSTTRMVCEAALELALPSDPFARRPAGLLTPATALGFPYMERLRRAGMTWDCDVL